MQQIIKIENRNGVAVVDSRLVADGLGIEHRALIQTVRKYQDVLEENFGLVAFEMLPRLAGAHGGGETIVAHLSKEQAEFLATLSKNTPDVIAFKAALVSAFNTPIVPALPQDYEEALVALLHKVKESKAKDLVIEQQQQQLTQAAPALAAHAALIASPGNILVNVAAKNMNLKDMGGKQLFVYLRNQNIVSSQPNNYNLPHQQYLTAGYFVVKSRPVNKPGFSGVKHTPYVTPAGLVYLYQRLVKAGYQAQTIKTLAQATKAIHNVSSVIKQLGGSITVNTNFLPL